METEYFKIIIGDKSIKLISKTDNGIYISFYKDTFKIRATDYFDKGGYWVHIPKEEDVLISVIVNNDKYFFYRVSNDIIVDVTRKIEFDFSLPITFVTGHSGGGTSIVVKLLKHLGIHFGDDSGLIDNRKTHESISMLSVLDYISESDPIFKIRDKFNSVMSLYNYRYNKINCFKKPYNEKSNIINLMGDVFPNIKFVSIVLKRSGYSKTTEGKEFNNKSEMSILETQYPHIEGYPVFHLDFKRFFMDYTYVNKLLKFLGSDNFINSDEDLKELKKMINFNEKVLSS